MAALVPLECYVFANEMFNYDDVVVSILLTRFYQYCQATFGCCED